MINRLERKQIATDEHADDHDIVYRRRRTLSLLLLLVAAILPIVTFIGFESGKDNIYTVVVIDAVAISVLMMWSISDMGYSLTFKHNGIVIKELGMNGRTEKEFFFNDITGIDVVTAKGGPEAAVNLTDGRKVWIDSNLVGFAEVVERIRKAIGVKI